MVMSRAASVAAIAALLLTAEALAPTAALNAAEGAAVAPPIPGAAAVARKARQGGGRVPVVVRLKAADAAVAEQRVDAAALERARDGLSRRLAGFGVAGVKPVGKSPFVRLEVDAQQLDALLKSGLAASVEEDVPLVRFLPQSLPIIGAPNAWSAGATGDGQVVVVIDDGVDSAHPFLAGRVVAEACAAPDCDEDPYANNGRGEGRPCPDCAHGTHVAGIAAGANGPGRNGLPASGVAPKAKIASIRVFSEEGATLAGIVAALDYVRTELAGKHKVAAVNLSLGTRDYASGSDCDADWPSLAHQIDGLRRAGIAVVASSGNDSNKRGIAAPACIGNAISVGATYDYDYDQPAPWSNYGRNLDLLAPGWSIVSSVPGRAYASAQGTSMAAPHVAGAIAALRSKAPDATVDQIEQAIESTGVVVRDSGELDWQVPGTPRIDVAMALNALDRSPVWREWVRRDGDVAEGPECEASGPRIDCWVRAKHLGDLQWTGTADGDRWSPWTSLGNTLGSGPDCVVRGARTDCFAVTKAKRLAQITHDGTGWGSWADLGGALSSTRRPSCVPAASGDGIDCFAVGGDRALWWLASDGRAWKPWSKVGGSAESRAECVRREGAVDCFVVDSGGQLRTRRLEGGKWGAWKGLGKNFASPPHCLPAGPAMDCFAVTTTRRLVHGRFSGSSWSSWAGTTCAPSPTATASRPGSSATSPPGPTTCSAASGAARRGSPGRTCAATSRAGRPASPATAAPASTASPSGSSATPCTTGRATDRLWENDPGPPRRAAPGASTPAAPRS